MISKFCLIIIFFPKIREDVIEEIIGREIIDETDVYVDNVTRSKVLREVRRRAASQSSFGTPDPRAPSKVPSFTQLLEEEEMPLLTNEESADVRVGSPPRRIRLTIDQAAESTSSESSPGRGRKRKPDLVAASTLLL